MSNSEEQFQCVECFEPVEHEDEVLCEACVEDLKIPLEMIDAIADFWEEETNV